MNFLHLLLSLLSSLEIDAATSLLLTPIRKLPTSFKDVCPGPAGRLYPAAAPANLPAAPRFLRCAVLSGRALPGAPLVS